MIGMNDTPFSTLELSSAMVHNLERLGYQSMTPVQAATLPIILRGKDLLAQAKTGSGKTAAFGIGLLNRIDVRQQQVQALVLCPTRELADQVAKALRQLARAIPNTKILTLSGGVPFAPQQNSLRHPPQIVVGTPGRVLKHLQKKSLSLDTLTTLVLDEADRMLDMGFIEEIETIIRATPKTRQTLLFSATYPADVRTLSDSIQRDTAHIETVSEEPPNRIEEHFYQTPHRERLETLLRILSHHPSSNTLIFSNTKQQCREISQQLNQRQIDTLALHGDLDQRQRNDAWIQFSNGSYPVLVATDVAARGLDISQLGMVINYEAPQDGATYTHRIGRTGRAGEHGLAITLVSPRDEERVATFSTPAPTLTPTSQLPESSLDGLQAEYQTLLIQGGKRDKLRPGDIVGALTQGGKLSGDQIGNINIFDRQSYVAVKHPLAKKACSLLEQGRIKKRKFTTRLLGKTKYNCSHY